MESIRYYEDNDGYDAINCVLNRYLPKWSWDRYEDYNNDYRWSKDSPPVQVKGFRRYYNVTSENMSKIDIHWIDLGSF